MANRIKCLRKLYQNSQVEFARMFNVEQSAVSNWENDRNKFDLSIASMISKHYQVPMEFLYGEPFEITRPQDAWNDDEIEDMENSPKECRDYFLYKYGRGVFYEEGERSTEQKISPEEPELNEGEKMLLELFRQIPDEAQKMYLEVLRASLKNQSKD